MIQLNCSFKPYILINKKDVFISYVKRNYYFNMLKGI